MLEADGYVAAQEPADAHSKPVPDDRLLRGGCQRPAEQSNADALADSVLPGAKVKELDAASDS